jgi:hypothetical protein
MPSASASPPTSVPVEYVEFPVTFELKARKDATDQEDESSFLYLKSLAIYMVANSHDAMSCVSLHESKNLPKLPPHRSGVDHEIPLALMKS